MMTDTGDSRNGGEILNEDVFDEFLTVSGDAAHDIIDAYLQNTETQTAELFAALEREDYAEARRCAHSMKSSSAQIGATDFARAAEQAELRALARTSDNNAEAVFAGDNGNAFKQKMTAAQEILKDRQARLSRAG